MLVKISFTSLVRRYACAILASFVTTFIAFNASPLAVAQGQPEMDTCSLRDVTIWQTEIYEPEEEQTPEYMRRVSEAFLSKCADRPEAPSAHKIAGIAASDMGDASGAVDHFAKAAPIRDVPIRFYEISALLADDKSRTAWQARDEMIEDWLQNLQSDPSTAVETRQVRGGEVHAVTFTRKDRRTGVSTLWVAVPQGPGWPATLTVGSDRQLTAFHRIRSGAALTHVDLYRCRGRRILAKSDEPIPYAEVDVSAETTLVAYLARPDQYESNGAGEPLSVCIWPNRLLPSAPR